MSAPKSDTATIEARKNRLLELLAEGKTQSEAAEILRVENYPADLRTVQRDVQSLRGQWGKENMTQFEQWRDEHIAELQELREKLEDPSIEAKDKIALALAIIREDSRIKGTAAPSKSITANVNADVDPAKLVGYREFLYHTRHLTEDDIRRLVYPFCDQLPPSETPAHLLLPSEDMKRGYCLESGS